MADMTESTSLIHILLCDDDAAFLARLEAAVADAMRELRVPAKVHAFHSGEEIAPSLLRACDIALLDIDFPRKPYNGIDIARALRAERRDAVILFVTNYVEYAPEGYEVQAFRYLLKSEIQTKLVRDLRLALEHLRKLRRTYPIQISGETIHLPMEDILYVESQKHTAVFHVRRGSAVKTYSVYSSLRSVEGNLAEEGFLRIQKSYLVNMRHILRYQCKEAVLTGNITLPVSEKNYAEQKRKYLLWKGRQ